MTLDRGPRGFDQDVPQVFSALLGDAPTAVCLSTIMDTRAEAGVAHQLLGCVKPRDGPQRAEHSHDGEQPKPGSCIKSGTAVAHGDSVLSRANS